MHVVSSVNFRSPLARRPSRLRTWAASLAAPSSSSTAYISSWPPTRGSNLQVYQRLFLKAWLGCVNPVAEVLLIESTGRYLYSGGAEPSDELAMKAADPDDHKILRALGRASSPAQR